MISSRRQAHSKIVEALGEKFSAENADSNFPSAQFGIGQSHSPARRPRHTR